MTPQESVENIPLDRRQEVFRAIVEAQDRNVSVKQSRTDAATQFGLTEEQVKEIEREGSENNWPPLD